MLLGGCKVAGVGNDTRVSRPPAKCVDRGAVATMWVGRDEDLRGGAGINEGVPLWNLGGKDIEAIGQGKIPMGRIPSSHPPLIFLCVARMAG